MSVGVVELKKNLWICANYIFVAPRIFGFGVGDTRGNS
jgi:hypothetical protein